MQKQMKSALISVFYKDGLAPIARQLHASGITIYSTGGTQQFLEKEVGVPCIGVETLTHYPGILGGRVKTLHPAVFGGILGRRAEAQDLAEMQEYAIPEIDLVIVDLYPFEETVAATHEEAKIIEKIDIGGPSMIRAAAKNFNDVLVVAAKEDYTALLQLLTEQKGATTVEQRRAFAAKAFEVVMHYDVAIHQYFNPPAAITEQVLRYGENPHQQASFKGNLSALFQQLHGKELSYNNLVDVEAAIQLLLDIKTVAKQPVFAIFKHTNVCGIAERPALKESWEAALAGDPESAFGGVLITDHIIDAATATAIREIFFEVLIAPGFDAEALRILQLKKNRILLQLNRDISLEKQQQKSLLNGILQQTTDEGNITDYKEVGGRNTTDAEKENLLFANLVCKHLKSNAIALVKDKQLVGKGCGQTSRIDALRHAIEKAQQFNFSLKGAVLASDAFFPFNDCVQIAHAAGIECYIQPGGSIRDKDSIDYCVEHQLAMVFTNLRHFKH